MAVLIIYETIEGQTGKIARFLHEKTRKAGHEVTVADASDKLVEVSFKDVDKVILAASVHERRHPRNFEVFVAANREQLNRRKTLMISVSLAAAFPERQEEARDYLTEMEMRTGLKPAAEALVEGAVRAGSYDYYATQILQHVILHDKDDEAADVDREFTDWDALGKKLSDFLAA